jgi:hypothetical protein
MLVAVMLSAPEMLLAVMQCDLGMLRADGRLCAIGMLSAVGMLCALVMLSAPCMRMLS